jgi:hypothetical protein
MKTLAVVPGIAVLTAAGAWGFSRAFDPIGNGNCGAFGSTWLGSRLSCWRARGRWMAEALEE